MYNDHLGNDKTLAAKNFFIKTLYWFNDNVNIDGASKKTTINLANNVAEPAYDREHATLHDV